jgi:hypothetical protein
MDGRITDEHHRQAMSVQGTDSVRLGPVDGEHHLQIRTRPTYVVRNDIEASSTSDELGLWDLLMPDDEIRSHSPILYAMHPEAEWSICEGYCVS